MSLIEYIGKKPQKADNVAGTGLVWAPGQTHEVKDPKAIEKLLFHKDVWALVDREALAAKAEAIRLEEEAMRQRREQVERELAEADERLRLAEIEEAAAAARAAEAEKQAAERQASEAGLSAKGDEPKDKNPADMEVEELRAFCASKGWTGHPLTGHAKLTAWLQEQAK